MSFAFDIHQQMILNVTAFLSNYWANNSLHVLPDREAEKRFLQYLYTAEYSRIFRPIVNQCVSERWNHALDFVLHTSWAHIPDEFETHHRTLNQVWVSFTSPVICEDITNCFLNHNLSFDRQIYKVNENDTPDRLVSLYNAGVNITDKSAVSRKSVDFMSSLLELSDFLNPDTNSENLFDFTRTLLHICKIDIRKFLGPCKRSVLEKRISKLCIPTILHNYIFEEF